MEIFFAFTTELLNHISEIIALIDRKPFYRESRKFSPLSQIVNHEGGKDTGTLHNPLIRDFSKIKHHIDFRQQCVKLYLDSPILC